MSRPLIPDIIRDRIDLLTVSAILAVLSWKNCGALGAEGTMIKVVDLFAGPGGLGEGFSSYLSADGKPSFRLSVSAEMDKAAHATLLLRAYFRRFGATKDVPKSYYAFLAGAVWKPRSDANLPDSIANDPEWKQAEKEALCLTLGREEDNKLLYSAIRSRVSSEDAGWILIGGPPCQAYSVVGRVRNRGNFEYRPESDHRHFLYREYLHVLDRFGPDVFIMENVRGLLSSTVGGKEIFAQVLEDLSDPGRALRRQRSSQYEIYPISHEAAQAGSALSRNPEDFLIYSEDHGIPQSRHRVILLGVRRGSGLAEPGRMRHHADETALKHALAGLPLVRSGVSDLVDCADTWKETVESQREKLLKILSHADAAPIVEKLGRLQFPADLTRGGLSMPLTDRDIRGRSLMPTGLREWLVDPRLDTVQNHETRSHMTEDLRRYLYCAAFSATMKYSPKSCDFPKKLAPNHFSWDDGAFKDRFRVHLPNEVAGTITSHISKDGHHFIHYDPLQCRTFTVREAARVQTFPDNYFFRGARTQQYTQVGNAVPPLLARQIAEIVWKMFAGKRASVGRAIREAA